MSYCRFSSDGFACDAYCYRSDFGVVIYVAARHRVHPEGLPYPSLAPVLRDEDALKAVIEAQNAWLLAARLDEIGPAHDGETIVRPDASSAARRLEHLRGLKYRVRQSAIDLLLEEASPS
jgi:hypothetical protein